MLTKPRRYQSEAYIDYIHSLECIICGSSGIAGVHAHHVRFAGEGSTGSKVSDLQCVPLCVTHHNDYHQIGRERFEDKHRVDLAKEIRRLNQTFIELLESRP